MQDKKGQAREEFITEGNQLRSQLEIEIEKRKRTYLSKAFNRLRLIIASNKKEE
jgi:hypothetical protein